VDLPLFLLSTISVAVFYLVAHRHSHGSLRSLIYLLPMLMAVGIGLCVGNTRAVIEALARHTSEFCRTPKYNLSPGDNLNTRRYHATAGRQVFGEAALALYFLCALVASGIFCVWGAIPVLLLFETGFAYTAASALLQHRAPVRPQTAQAVYRPAASSRAQPQTAQAVYCPAASSRAQVQPTHVAP